MVLASPLGFGLGWGGVERRRASVSASRFSVSFVSDIGAFMEQSDSRTWQEIADEFFMLVGYCITAWADVDHELFECAATILKPHRQAAIVYYRQPGLDIRMELVNELIVSLFPSPSDKPGSHPHTSLKHWQTVLSDTKPLLSTRRRIAHHPVDIRLQNKGGAPSTILGAKPDFIIKAGQHEVARKPEKLPPLSVDDLRAHLKQVTDAEKRIREFRTTTLQTLGEALFRQENEQRPATSSGHETSRPKDNPPPNSTSRA